MVVVQHSWRANHSNSLRVNVTTKYTSSCFFFFFPQRHHSQSLSVQYGCGRALGNNVAGVEFEYAGSLILGANTKLLCAMALDLRCVQSDGEYACNYTCTSGCLRWERTTAASVSCVASLVLGGYLLRTLLRAPHRPGQSSCKRSWPKFHHYAIFLVAVFDCLVALNYVLVRRFARCRLCAIANVMPASI